MYEVETGPIPFVDIDPAATWAVLRGAIQTVVEMTYIPDVLIHTRDLAQAVGVEVTLDPSEVGRQAAAVDAIPPELDAAMRSSGHFGRRLETSTDADELTRVLAFYGRRAPSP